MGHIRLGTLPRTRRWQEVVALLAGGARAEQVATATLRAAEHILGNAYSDQGLVEAVWLILRLPLAARSAGFVSALRGLGLDVPDSPGLMDILAAFSETIDARMPNNQGRTDLGEMAQMAAVETLASILAVQTQGLFGTSPDDVRRALSSLGTTHQVSILGRRYYARLMYKFLDFYLSRTLSDHVGPGQRFDSLGDVDQFSRALETHCNEAARYVEEFSGEWFSKYRWETRGDITRDSAAKFAHGALKKLVADLLQGAGANG